jgi:biotin transport system substrate-specific component
MEVISLSSAALTSPRRGYVLADLLPNVRFRDATLVAGGAVLTGLAAQIAVPIPGTPVPVTGQTFAVLLFASALGLWRAFASMATYLAAGVAGVPWFAGHSSGFGGPSMGYVIGFLAAAVVVGHLARAGGDRTPLRTFLTMTAGTAVIYTFGIAWLSRDLGVGLGDAFALGMRPFLIGDLLKALLAAALLPTAWTLVRRLRDA